MNDYLNKALTKLESNAIRYEILMHQELYSMNDVEKILNIPYTSRVKSLLIKSKKNDKYYVCGITAKGKLDFKKVANAISSSRSQLVFATQSEYEEMLSIPLGSLGSIVPESIGVLLSRNFINEHILYFGIGTNFKTLKIEMKELAKIQEFMLCDIEE